MFSFGLKAVLITITFYPAIQSQWRRDETNATTVTYCLYNGSR